MSSETETCSRCGGQLPTAHANADSYLVRADGHCTGAVAVDDDGSMLGCGAWHAAAYALDREEAVELDG